MIRLWTLASLTALLTSGCATGFAEPERIIVEQYVRVPPPEWLLEDCKSKPGDGTLGGEVKRLEELVQCERADKAGIKAWMQGIDPKEAV